MSPLPHEVTSPRSNWRNRSGRPRAGFEISYPSIRREVGPDIKLMVDSNNGFRRFGFSELVELSQMTSWAGIHLAPHNWGSFLGLYMQLTPGRGIPNFLIAEQDPGQTDLFDTSSFQFKEGKVRLSDAPGCGLEIRTEEFAKLKKIDWEVS